MIIKDKRYKKLSSSLVKMDVMNFLKANPRLKKSYESLFEYGGIMSVTPINNEFFLVRKFSPENGVRSITLFNYKNPRYEKPETVSLEDRNAIKKLLTKNITTTKKIVESTVLPKVLGVTFYNIEVKISEAMEDGVTSSSSENIQAYKTKRGKFYIFDKDKDLIKVIKRRFKLKKKSALLFQDALDVIIPLGYFDKKHKKYYKKGNSWYFVRGKSFGKEKGIVVKVNRRGNIKKISKIGEKKSRSKIRYSRTRE